MHCIGLVQRVEAGELQLGGVLRLVEEEFGEATSDGGGNVWVSAEQPESDPHRIVGRQNAGGSEDRGLSTPHLGSDGRDDRLCGPGDAPWDLRDDQVPVRVESEPVECDPLRVVAMDR